MQALAKWRFGVFPASERFFFRVHFPPGNTCMDFFALVRCFPRVFHCTYARDHSARRQFCQTIGPKPLLLIVLSNLTFSVCALCGSGKKARVTDGIRESTPLGAVFGRWPEKSRALERDFSTAEGLGDAAFSRLFGRAANGTRRAGVLPGRLRAHPRFR